MNSTLDAAKQKAHFDRALGFLRAGDGEGAADECALALKSYPDDPNLLCLAARACIMLGLFKNARTHADKAIAIAPAFSVAHETRGDVFLANGYPAKAKPFYARAIELDPGRSDLHLKLQRAIEDAEHDARDRHRNRFVATYKDEIQEAAELDRIGEHARAENIYRDILAKDPDHVEAIRLLAAVAMTNSRYEDALVLLRRAVEVEPQFGRAWADLCKVQCELELHSEAIESGRQVVALAGTTPEAHVTLGNAYGRAGRNEEAIESYRNALRIRPGHTGAYSGLGQQLKVIGRQDEAIAAHRECIALNPRSAEHYWALANMKTVRFDDKEVDAMLALLRDESLDGRARVEIHNSLGFAYESRKDYDTAFGHFSACCELQRQSQAYDPVETEVTTDRIIETMDREFLHRHAGHGVDDASPIFIVGLPRSGSTLIEQILASHSAVEGTHELAELPAIVRDIPKNRASGGRFPESIASFGGPDWRRIGKRYIEGTAKYRRGAIHFIDKNPNNFAFVGLISLILPNASIINARRHPMDSCFGSYKQLFASGQPFTYDLAEIGEYYLQYQRLMDHWHAVVPGKVLDVRYEDVVADLDSQVARLLAHCGLPFEEACLSFHETRRAIRTASSEQVRRPIYASSVDLWKNYETHLGELHEVLAPLLQR